MTAESCTGIGGRGCPCAFHQARRLASRKSAARKRRRELEARQRGSQICQQRHGSAICGTVLTMHTDGNGAATATCPKCERRRVGLCRDCPAPVAGRVGTALRCAKHKEIARKAQMRAHQERNRDEINVRANERYHADEVARQRKLDYKRLWRKANPDKVRAAKRRYAMRHGAGGDSRYLEYHRRYNAQTARQQAKRAAARATYYRRHPVRPDPRCRTCNEPIPWTPGQGRPPLTCDQHCTKYQLAARLKNRAAAAVAVPKVQPPKPVRPKLRIRHPMPVRYDAAGHRLCITPGCDIVVTRRKKKCTKCRDRELAAARAAIAAKHAGRGRRTDLEHVA